MLRKPSKEEKTLINRSFDSWAVFESLKDLPIFLNETKNEKQVVLVSKALVEVIEREQPFSAGLVIGTLKKTFTPSMAGADLFSRLNKDNLPQISVNEEAEKLVLYGRDVMGNSIVSASESLEENMLVIILNKTNDAIGIGKTRFSGKSLYQKGKVTVTTIMDAGYYLREE